MARGYAKLSVKELADVSGVAASTIKRMEAVEGVPASSGSNLEKVQKALEGQGVQFLDPGDAACGVGISVSGGE
ncbi:hypothetical protein [Pseudooceanicola sp. MF1-13]|uniref:hypothetical protein n=1 Tax=Pseudooceanicola sp. MF1-13 TaxID=3379095 RepID=UPI003892B100